MDTITIYSSMLEELNRTIVRMTSAEFDALLQTGTTDDRRRAALELLDVQQARLVLGNAVLSAIADKLKANEQAFIDGRNDLQAALQRLNSIESVLTTITKFIGVVGRVVALV